MAALLVSLAVLPLQGTHSAPGVRPQPAPRAASGDPAAREPVKDLALREAGGDLALRETGGDLALREAVGDLALREIDGELHVTLHARQGILVELLQALAQRSGRKLVGAQLAYAAAPLDVHLDERPFHTVVHTLVGASALRARILADRIELLPEALAAADELPAAELDTQGEVAYLRALKDFREHPGAARAELALAEVQERRRNWSAAREHYDLLAGDYPNSEHVPAALLGAGRMLQQQGEWTQAAQRFATLANLTRPHPLQADARLELARCLVQSGDARQALFVLDGLDTLFVAANTREMLDRLHLRARAHVGVHEPHSALRALDAAELHAAGQHALAAEFELDGLEARAAALEQLGGDAQAARAWLRVAEHPRATRREQAFGEAARLSLAAGDALAVLFIEKSAARHAIETAPELAREARAQLGLAAERSSSALLAQGEQLCAARRFNKARLALEALFQSRAQLESEALTRLLLAYARALDGDRDVDAALGMLRANVHLLESVADRKRVYVLAGELLEARDRFDEAVEAYGGRL